MITLTTPPEVLAVLGGTTKVAYEKMVLTSIAFNTPGLSSNCTFTLTSTSAPEMQPIKGNLQIDTGTARLTLECESLNFFRKVALTGPQNSAMQTIIRDAQDAIESGLVSLGLIDGTQQTGT